MALSISIRIEFYNGIVRFLCHSTAFLYTSATVQMLKLHAVLGVNFSQTVRSGVARLPLRQLDFLVDVTFPKVVFLYRTQHTLSAFDICIPINLANLDSVMPIIVVVAY